MITPQPGWQVDPNNPNGVIPIPGYNASAPTVTPAKPASADNPIPTSTGVQDGPYTPAQVAAAVKSTSSAGSSSFSSSALGGGAGTTASTVASAGAALSGQSQPGQFTFQGGTYNTNSLPVGMTTTPPTEGGYSTVATPNGPIYVAANFGVNPNQSFQSTSGGAAGTLALPQGVTASTPDASGNVTYTSPTGAVTINPTSLPSGATVSSYLNNVSSVSGALSALGTGYSYSTAPNGEVTVNTPQGPITIGASTIANDPSGAISQIQGLAGVVSSTNQTTSAAVQTLQSQQKAAIDALNLEKDAAEGSAGAATGGFGSASESGAASRYDQLISETNEQYAAAIATAQAQGNTTINQAYEALGQNMTSIEKDAQSTLIGLSQFATGTQQTQFAAAQKTLTSTDWSTVPNLPQGGVASLTLNANGQTGNAAIDQAIKNLVQNGNGQYTPASALAMIQSQTLSGNKAQATQWLANLKNFGLPDLSKVSLTDAMNNPQYGQLLSQLVQQGSNLYGGSTDAAYQAIQSSVQQQMQQLDLQKLEAQTALTQEEAVLAPEKAALSATSGAINDATKILNDNFKGSTTSPAPLSRLASVSYWMPNVEAAYSQIQAGNYQAFPTLLDALNKLDTGGQAIRQGQQQIQMDAGTLQDNLQALGTKYGFSTTGATYDQYGNLQWSAGTPQVSAKQLQGMYADAQAIAGDVATQSQTGYADYKTSIQNLQTQFPDASGDISGVTQGGIDAIDSFYSEYGSSSSSSSGSASSILAKYGIQ